jgi:Zn finger protein HypA/HybF involved in hydrogenase expression
MQQPKIPRKGFDTVEPQFLCPHCKEIIKDKNLKPGTNELYECPNCHEMINTTLIAPPTIVIPPGEK